MGARLLARPPDEAFFALASKPRRQGGQIGRGRARAPVPVSPAYCVPLLADGESGRLSGAILPHPMHSGDNHCPWSIDSRCRSTSLQTLHSGLPSTNRKGECGAELYHGRSIASSDQASQSLLVNDRLLGTAPAEDQTCSLWRPTTRTVAPNFVCGSSLRSPRLTERDSC
jgi:hypothetical protein